MRSAAAAAAILLAASSAPGSPPIVEDPIGRLGKPDLRAAEVRRETGDRGFDCLELRLELRLDFDTRTILGRAIHRLSATAPLDTVRFDLTDSLAVQAIWRGATLVPFVHRDRALRIPLIPPLPPGAETEIGILYGGRPPREGLLGFSFQTRDGVPAAYTLSEPTASAAWWPCKDVPDDKLLATIILDIPDTLYAGSNGLLVEDRIEGGRRRMVWRESWPVAPYLVGLACTNYAVAGDLYLGIDGTPLPLLYLAYPEHLDAALRSWGRTGEMLALFEERFGPYPFPGEKYGMAEFSWGGAMEHQTLSSIGEYAIDGTDANDWLVAHELAHHWWGNWVTLANWDHMWLNEGFARYSEALWYESRYGMEQGYREWIRRMWRPTFAGPLVPPDFLFSATVYLKGAWVVHMLRGVLGDPAFFGALSRYGNRHAYGNADTEDFRRACEEEAGIRLDWFFDQWVYGIGRPAYSFSWSAIPGEAGNAVLLTIEQSQPGSTFRMPIEIEIEDERGRYYAVVEDSLRIQSFRIPVRLPPIGLRIDPNDWILKDWIGGSSVSETPIAISPIGIPRPSPGTPPFRIPVASSLRGGAVELFDIHGRRVRALPVGDGAGAVVWDGADAAGRPVSSGVYLLRHAGSGAEDAASRRIWLIR